MKIKILFNCLMTTSLLLITTPASEASLSNLKLPTINKPHSQTNHSVSNIQNFLNDPNNLQWCRTEVGRAAKVASSQSKKNTNGKFDTNFAGNFVSKVGIDAGSQGTYNSNSSSNSFQQESSEYKSRNCDSVLKTMGDITIAEINANKEVALATIKADVQKYGIDAATGVALHTNNTNLAGVLDTNRTGLAGIEDTNRTGLAGVLDTNKTNLAVANVNANASTNNTLIGTIGGVLSTAIATSNAAPQQPPSNANIAPCPTSNDDPRLILINCSTGRPLAAPLVATAPSDPVAQLLAQWGWSRIDCRPGVVFITNIIPTPVCVNATEGVPPGQYTYDVASNQLQPLKPSLPQTIERGNDESPSISDQEDSPDDVEEFEQIDGGEE